MFSKVVNQPNNQRRFHSPLLHFSLPQQLRVYRRHKNLDLELIAVLRANDRYACTLSRARPLNTTTTTEHVAAFAKTMDTFLN